MKNIEKYKDNIESNINVCGLYQEIFKIRNGEYAKDCCSVCDRCYDDCISWLAEEYKGPILDDTEKKYLSNAIKPFRKMIAYIVKAQDFDDGKQCIRIILQNGDGMHFPYLDDDEMYKGMEVNKDYSLEELGL